MEALTTLHHRHQPLYSSVHPSLTSTTASSLFLSQPAPSPPPSSSIRASSSSSPPSSDPLQILQYPEPKTPQSFNHLPKVPSFDPSLQDPNPKSPQFPNPIPKVPSFAPLLQDPNPNCPQFFKPIPKVPSFDPPLQDPKLHQFLNPIPKFPSFATLTAAASAFLFLGYCQHGFNKPMTSLSSVMYIEEEETLDEKSDIGEFLGSKPDHVESVLHLKLKERVPVVHSFKKTKTDDEEAWQVLKAQVFSCSENLEFVKVGFEEILEKDMDCNKEHHDRVLEYLERVDEYNGMLKGIEVVMNRCERENADKKHCIRFFSKVVARIRVLEGDMVGALKDFKELERE